MPASVLADARPRLAGGPRIRPGIGPRRARRSRSRTLPADPESTPDVLGFSARQAIALFARAGVLARLQGSGFVVAQDPPAGAPTRAGAVHTLFLADSAPAPARAAGRRAQETAPPPPAP